MARLQGGFKAAVEQASRPKLRFRWPAHEAHLCDVFAKIQTLRAAIRELHDGECSQRTARREFGEYVARLGVNTRTLGYAQLATAMRQMPGECYLALTFRHAVVGREVGKLKSDRQESTAPVDGDPTLLEALNTDADIMLCLMRWLDRDCDGVVSEMDFASAIMELPSNIDDALDEARSLAGRWTSSQRSERRMI